MVPQEILLLSLEEGEDVVIRGDLRVVGMLLDRAQGESFTMEYRMESWLQIKSVVAWLKPLN